MKGKLRSSSPNRIVICRTCLRNRHTDAVMNTGFVIANTHIQLAKLALNLAIHGRVCGWTNLTFRPTSRNSSSHGGGGGRSRTRCFRSDTRGGGGTSNAFTHSRNANSLTIGSTCIGVIHFVTSTVLCKTYVMRDIELSIQNKSTRSSLTKQDCILQYTSEEFPHRRHNECRIYCCKRPYPTGKILPHSCNPSLDWQRNLLGILPQQLPSSRR